MNPLWCVVAVSVACVSVLAEVEVNSEGVLVLTASTFKEGLEMADNTLVEFYAPWCGHCKALAPEWAKAAQSLTTDHPDVSAKLAMVDSTQESGLAQEHGVRGYPTIKFFRKGADQPSDYNGGRTAKEIVSWIVKKTGPPAAEIADEDGAEKFAQSVKEAAGETVAVVGCFSDQSTPAAQAFSAAASSMDDVKFHIVSSEPVMKKLEATDNSVHLFRNFDEERVTFEGEISESAVTKFAKDNRLAYLTEFSDESAPRIFGGEVKTHSLLFCDKGASETLLAEYKQVAIPLKGKAIFIYLDISVPGNSRVMDFFGIKPEDGTQLRVIRMGAEMEKYKAELTEFTRQSIADFVNGVLEGKIKKHLMTEEVSEDWEKAPVKVLVGKNFEQVALDADKDVLVEFYAPWCGHCKELAPIYDELGEHYRENEKIVIAKMDSTKNEQGTVPVKGFPTIVLFRSQDNKAITFQGGRTLDDLRTFVDSRGQSQGEDDESEGTEGDGEEEGAPREEL